MCQTYSIERVRGLRWRSWFFVVSVDIRCALVSRGSSQLLVCFTLFLYRVFFAFGWCGNGAVASGFDGHGLAGASVSWSAAGAGWCWSVGLWGMERSRIEHALSKAAVNAERCPSELALDAIVAGVRVEDTRPSVAGVDMVWPAAPTFL